MYMDIQFGFNMFEYVWMFGFFERSKLIVFILSQYRKIQNEHDRTNETNREVKPSKLKTH